MEGMLKERGRQEMLQEHFEHLCRQLAVCLASASRADGEVEAVCYGTASKCCFDTGHAERMRTRYPAIDSIANSVVSIPNSLVFQGLARLNLPYHRQIQERRLWMRIFRDHRPLRTAYRILSRTKREIYQLITSQHICQDSRRKWQHETTRCPPGRQLAQPSIVRGMSVDKDGTVSK